MDRGQKEGGKQYFDLNLPVCCCAGRKRYIVAATIYGWLRLRHRLRRKLRRRLGLGFRLQLRLRLGLSLGHRLRLLLINLRLNIRIRLHPQHWA